MVREVAERLTHLLAVDAQRTRVHPGVHELLAVGSFTLSDFIFMVREHQVGTAAVNIKRFCLADHSSWQSNSMQQPGTSFGPIWNPTLVQHQVLLSSKRAKSPKDPACFLNS